MYGTQHALTQAYAQARQAEAEQVRVARTARLASRSRTQARRAALRAARAESVLQSLTHG